MGRPVLEVVRGVDTGIEAASDALWQVDPGTVRREVGQRAAAVRVQTGAQESGNGVRSLLEQFHDGDIDDYANNGD